MKSARKLKGLSSTVMRVALSSLNCDLLVRLAPMLVGKSRSDLVCLIRSFVELGLRNTSRAPSQLSTMLCPMDILAILASTSNSSSRASLTTSTLSLKAKSCNFEFYCGFSDLVHLSCFASSLILAWNSPPTLNTSVCAI